MRNMDNWTNKDLRIKNVFRAQFCHFPTKGDGRTLVRCGLASRPHPITQECTGVLGWRLVFCSSWVFICMSWVFLAKMLLVGVSKKFKYFIDDKCYNYTWEIHSSKWSPNGLISELIKAHQGDLTHIQTWCWKSLEKLHTVEIRKIEKYKSQSRQERKHT